MQAVDAISIYFEIGSANLQTVDSAVATTVPGSCGGQKTFDSEPPSAQGGYTGADESKGDVGGNLLSALPEQGAIEMMPRSQLNFLPRLSAPIGQLCIKIWNQRSSSDIILPKH